MITPDTSVVVAGFASWHEHHGDARRVLAEPPRLVAHVALEAYSVLTRLPPPHRADPELVGAFLGVAFPEPPLVLDEQSTAALIPYLARAGIVGGAAYDGLVAATARAAGAELVTLDRRAVPVYRALDAPYRLLVG